ncbi:MAG: hypothetical protein ACFWTK_01970 [Clostridium sp.]|jgi:hypothetical protein
MNANKYILAYRFLVLLLKCYLIIFTLGILIPKIIDFILCKFIIEFNRYRDITFVFNVLSVYEIILYKYTYMVNTFFKL